MTLILRNFAVKQADFHIYSHISSYNLQKKIFEKEIPPFHHPILNTLNINKIKQVELVVELGWNFM